MEAVLGFVPEKTIVAKACRGDRRAFSSLHERYAPMVHAVLLARVPPGEAEDLVQDVFLRALENIHTLRDAGAIGGWLCTLARNRAADFHRRGVKHAPLPEDLPARGDGAFEARDVLAAIRALPETYAETIAMRLVEGMTGPEIAKATGMTPGSVRVHLHRGIKLLRARLGGEEER